MNADDFERQRRDLGLASWRLNSSLRQLAESERNLHPDEPRIHCAMCDQWAQEIWYFCSRECRDAFIDENLSGGCSP